MTDLNDLALELRRVRPALPAALLERQRARLMADPAARISRPERRTLPLALALGGALLAAAAFVLWFVRPAAESPTTSRALAAVEAPLRFGLDDGTSIRLDTGARGVIAERSSRGVHFALERGRADFDVAPQHGGTFRVSAGKHQITVLGTRFSVSWTPPDDLLVEVDHGLVSVREAGKPEVRLGAGQRFQSSSPRAIPESVPAEQGSSVAASPLPVAPLSAPSQSATPSRPDWRSLYRQRDYKAALAAARQAGFERLASSLDQSALTELSDTARLAGGTAEALIALRALERRFPGTAQGRQAAFLIGRVLVQSGDAAGGSAAFERYLEVDPGGVYATEAIGRLVELYAKRGDTTRAREMARRYLARAPSGPYQRLARSLLDAQ